MAVYVDRLTACMANSNWQHRVSCHCIADSVDELQEFAACLGLKRERFQDGYLPHYDLTATKRKKAVRLGAIQLGRDDFVAKVKEWRLVQGNQRGAVLLVLLIPVLLIALAVIALFAGVRGMQAQVFGHTGMSALSGATNNPQEHAPGVQPTPLPELRGPLDLGTAGLVCVKLPGVSYPKTPALDRRVAPRLFGAIQELERQNAPDLRFNYGFRSTCEQTRIQPVGTAQKARPGTSAHERGAAVDVAQLRARADRQRVIRVFREQGWTWGSADWPHFEVKAHVVGEPDRFEWVRRQQRDFNAGRVTGGCRGADCGGL